MSVRDNFCELYYLLPSETDSQISKVKTLTNKHTTLVVLLVLCRFVFCKKLLNYRDLTCRQVENPQVLHTIFTKSAISSSRKIL